MVPLPIPLGGIVTPLLTPLREIEVLDAVALERLVDHVIGGGVNGLFPLGTTGQGPALTPKLRQHVLMETVRAAGGRVPVLAGITDTSLEGALELAAASAACGVAAVVSAGPLYFPVSQDELVDYMRVLAAGSPLPLFLYNIPGCSHVTFSPETVERLAMLPNIAGLKDSSANLMYLKDVRRRLAGHPSFSILIGPEELLGEAMLLGANGGVNGGSNLFPRLYTALYEASVAGDIPRMRRLSDQTWQLSQAVYSTSPNASGYIRGIVCAAAALGLCREVVSPPYHPIGDEARASITRFVSSFAPRLD